jgi:hypothetical protein
VWVNLVVLSGCSVVVVVVLLAVSRILSEVE